MVLPKDYGLKEKQNTVFSQQLKFKTNNYNDSYSYS